MVRKRLKQLRALSLEEWRLLCISLVLLPFTAVWLHFFGYNKTRSLLASFIRTDVKNSLSDARQQVRAEQVARIVSVAAHHGFFRVNCLKKSLVTWWLLMREGIAVELKIGVAVASGFQSHAWTEFKGEVLAGPGNGAGPGISDAYVVIAG